MIIASRFKIDRTLCEYLLLTSNVYENGDSVTHIIVRDRNMYIFRDMGVLIQFHKDPMSVTDHPLIVSFAIGDELIETCDALGLYDYNQVVEYLYNVMYAERRYQSTTLEIVSKGGRMWLEQNGKRILTTVPLRPDVMDEAESYHLLGADKLEPILQDFRRLLEDTVKERGE